MTNIKVSGVKSIDFAITAKGHGVVNWNGSVQFGSYKNHAMPKLQNMTVGKLDLETINFSDHPLYVSSNCVRHFLFKDQNLDTYQFDKDGSDQMIGSLAGLVRGYMHANSGIKRKGPLMIENFVDQLGNGTTYEQFVSSSAYVETECYQSDDEGYLVTKKGERIQKNDSDEFYKNDVRDIASMSAAQKKKLVVTGTKIDKSNTSMFSKTTFLETSYTAYGSISIEDLAFICADFSYGRSAINSIEKAKDNIQKYLDSLNQKHGSQLSPSLESGVFHRIGSAFPDLTGEQGILLNDDAIMLVLMEFFDRLNSLYIQQAKGYLYADSLHVHFNDTTIPMAIKQFETVSQYRTPWDNVKTEPVQFAKYYAQSVVE